MAVGEDVYVTLVMSDSYLPGAAVLAHSLRDACTKKKLAVMITLDSLAATTITELKSLYDYVIPVDRVGNPNPSNLYLMGRPDLSFAFTKIALWRQTRFRKVVYVDADVVALRAPDELFDLEANFAAAPDVGWPDAFNSGVMVLTPNMGDYWALQTLAASGDSFDGADQGLLNQYYEHRNWHRISFLYNCTPNASYQYEPAFQHHKSGISMVHFIGKEKPWFQGKHVKGAPSAYNQLRARWWAVYDRHFKAPTTAYISGQYAPASNTVQQQVKGEATNVEYGYSSIQPSQPVPGAQVQQPEQPAPTIEQPLMEPGEAAENIEQGIVQPVPTTQQRRFSAPHAEWDATRTAPPAGSKPEASNFPAQTYTFNEDRELFHAPQSYPEPPKDMWFKVPEEKPKPAEKPEPIFPWEEREQTKPTRVFAEDLPSEPEPTPARTEASTDEDSPAAPPTPTIKVTSEEPWQAWQSGRSRNAWDEVVGIDEYVRALTESHKRKGKVQVLQQSPSINESVSSPTAGQSRRERRESLILTDFPTAIERPSLPVTPAPRRKQSFWGEERDEAGDLPPAEGVPNQADWDPTEKLEELRRLSLAGTGDLKLPPAKKMPKRELPPSSAPIPLALIDEHPHVPVAATPTGAEKTVAFAEPDFAAATDSAKPIFNEPDFNTRSPGPEEVLLSPTEHGSRNYG
ncbi:glycogenin glucosyltransferase [Cryomyces antarcticus]|nr:glycogenin glucosyltransferase [Cryomyces antarcticus]